MYKISLRYNGCGEKLEDIVKKSIRRIFRELPLSTSSVSLLL